MPLPLIPALLIGSSAIAAVKGLYDSITASKNIAELKALYAERRTHYDSVECIYRRHHYRTTKNHDKLMNVRLESLVTLGEASAFLQKARVRQRDLREDLTIPQEQLQLWAGLSLQAVDLLRGVARGAGAGAVTASSIYGLVGVFGAASTGTAIGSLSGAAATSATMAWLGGGALAAGGGGMALGTAVLGGLVAGPAMLVSGFFINSKAEAIRTEVTRQMAEMDIAEANFGRHQAALMGINTRIAELCVATIEAQDALESTLQRASPQTDEDAFLVYKLARGLAGLIDIKVFTQDHAAEESPESH